MAQDQRATPHCRKLVRVMEHVFRDIEGGMTPPVPVRLRDGYVVRFPNRDINHALLLKLAAMLQFLNSSIILCEAGLVLAQGAVQRMAEEASDDALFLSLGIIHGVRKIHVDYLERFWADAEDDPSDIESVTKPSQIPRNKILAEIHREWSDPSTADKLAKRISKTYSGYVHAAAANVMDIYDPQTGQFGVSGAAAYRQMDHDYDLWNVFYRCALTLITALKALGSQAHVDALGSILMKFQVESGRDGGYRGERQQ